MNRRLFTRKNLSYFAIALSLWMVIPAIVNSQDGGGWQQRDDDVYIKGGRVGIGDVPRDQTAQLQILNNRSTGGNAELILAAKNNNSSGISMREGSSRNWGFSILYDGNAIDPLSGQKNSGMFGLWRILEGVEQDTPVLSAYLGSSNVGIGAYPSDRADVRLRVGGHQAIRGPSNWNKLGDEARLYLGDYSHWIQASYGIGIQISPSRAINAVTIQEGTGNVGIGARPSERADVKLRIAGHQLVRGPSEWQNIGDEARLYLGDYSHWIQSRYGTGIQISPSRAANAVTIQEETGYVGIGTESPTAMLEVIETETAITAGYPMLRLSGASGVGGISLTLTENTSQYTGQNSPNIRWDSTNYTGPAGPVEKFWLAFASGEDWILQSANPGFTDTKVIIRAQPNGEICIGHCQ